MADRDKRVTNGESAVARTHGWFSDKIEEFREFYNETRYEMQRVTWPTRDQVQSTTIVVVLTVFFFGAFFYVADTLIMGPAIKWLFAKLAQGS